MATVPVWPITLSLWLLFFKHLPTVESTWNCSLKAQTYYVYYDRLDYCYKTSSSNTPRVPSIEGQDIGLQPGYSSRSNKVIKCAQAAMGRGYKYFALFNNGECRSSWTKSDYSYYGYERTTNQYCYYYCYHYCYSRCYYYLTKCGDGYGSSTKMNVYTFDYSYDVMIWIRIHNNNFRTHFDMFDASFPDYVSVNDTISTWYGLPVVEAQMSLLQNVPSGKERGASSLFALFQTSPILFDFIEYGKSRRNFLWDSIYRYLS